MANQDTVETPTMTCMSCGYEMKLQVLSSGAGFYLGFRCPRCGPYARESGYYETREQAEQSLEIYLSTD
jgi:tRNA(Ile2) C34 agmatinyltransferase TiaS